MVSNQKTKTKQKKLYTLTSFAAKSTKAMQLVGQTTVSFTHEKAGLWCQLHSLHFGSLMADMPTNIKAWDSKQAEEVPPDWFIYQLTE